MADRDSDGEPKEGVPDHAESAGIPISSEDPTTGPRRRRGLWTAEREDLFAALESQNLTCAHLYREAVDALGSADFGVGKLVVAGHAIRELVNLLPVVLADVTFPDGFATTTSAQAWSRPGPRTNPESHQANWDQVCSRWR